MMPRDARAVRRGGVATPERGDYTACMSSTFHTVAIEALNLDEADRLRLAAELIDSVEGPADPDWERAWGAELDRRSDAADDREARGEPRGVEWAEVRASILRRLATR